MPEFLARSNISKLEKQLKTSTDPVQIRMLEELIGLERAKFIAIHALRRKTDEPVFDENVRFPKS